MGLRDLVLPSAEIEVAGEKLSFRGLNLNDFTGLFYRRKALSNEVFKSLMESFGRELTQPEQATLLVRMSPEIMGEVIALASGENPNSPEYISAVEIAMRLPAGVQVEALQKIAGITFTQDMPPGKILALAMEMLIPKAEGDPAKK